MLALNPECLPEKRVLRVCVPDPPSNAGVWQNFLDDLQVSLKGLDEEHEGTVSFLPMYMEDPVADTAHLLSVPGSTLPTTFYVQDARYFHKVIAHEHFGFAPWASASVPAGLALGEIETLAKKLRAVVISNPDFFGNKSPKDPRVSSAARIFMASKFYENVTRIVSLKTALVREDTGELQGHLDEDAPGVCVLVTTEGNHLREQGAVDLLRDSGTA